MHSVADILGHDAGRARRQTEKIETRSDRRAVFRLIEMASGVRSIDLGIESGNQADPLLLEKLYMIPRDCGFSELPTPGLCGFIHLLSPKTRTRYRFGMIFNFPP